MRETGPTAAPAAPRGSAELRQDADIFDTWFSSGLWPFSTLGWPEATPDLDRFYPGTVMETGYDIIFFWVARMMMLGEWLTGREPFGIVYLHGMVRDPYGAKMSKTSGNVVDPLGVIDEVGADALRFALVNGTAPGMDQQLSPSRLEGARNFANKLWNASRYVLVAAARGAAGRRHPVAARRGRAGPRRALDPGALRGHPARGRCRLRVVPVRRGDAPAARRHLERVLRLVPGAGQDAAGAGQAAAVRVATWQVLAWVLDRYLRLLHPVMPHITEHIWAAPAQEPRTTRTCSSSPAGPTRRRVTSPMPRRRRASPTCWSSSRPSATPAPTRASRPAPGWPRRSSARDPAAA